MLSDPISFPGRILFLTENPEGIFCQLKGEDLEPADVGPLRDQISTDEITPAFICYHYDERLGDFPYLGLKCGDMLPVKDQEIARLSQLVSDQQQQIQVMNTHHATALEHLEDRFPKPTPFFATIISELKAAVTLPRPPQPTP